MMLAFQLIQNHWWPHFALYLGIQVRLLGGGCGRIRDAQLLSGQVKKKLRGVRDLGQDLLARDLYKNPSWIGCGKYVR